ncbi:hypothetical protein ACWGS9_29210 [Bradyrhizobium sp. Arg314]
MRSPREMSTRKPSETGFCWLLSALLMFVVMFIIVVTPFYVDAEGMSCGMPSGGA